MHVIPGLANLLSRFLPLGPMGCHSVGGGKNLLAKNSPSVKGNMIIAICTEKPELISWIVCKSRRFGFFETLGNSNPGHSGIDAL